MEKIVQWSTKKRLSSNSFAPQKYPIDSSKRQSLNRKVMIHIIQDIRPIATVEQPGFRGLIHALDPKYVLPKRSTVVQMMTKTFDSVVAKMQSELEQVYYCALTTDMWSSMNYDSFNGITVHYWHAESLTLKSRVLDCSKFEARHTSEELAKDITKYLQKFNIELKLAGILSDHAKNIVKALKDLLQLPWMGCLAHGFNLIYEDAYADSPLLQTLRDQVNNILILAI